MDARRHPIAAALLVFALAEAPAFAKPKVTRPALLNLERAMDKILEREVLESNGFLLLGATRGVYLEGSSAVFSAEVNLAAGPTVSPFRPEVTKDDTARLRQKKLDKLPVLRAAMRQLMFEIAARLDTMPSEEEVVVAVTLFHHHWEDTTALPAQIVMRAPRKRLIETPTAKRDPAQLESLIRIEEF